MNDDIDRKMMAEKSKNIMAMIRRGAETKLNNINDKLDDGERKAADEMIRTLVKDLYNGSIALGVLSKMLVNDERSGNINILGNGMQTFLYDCSASLTTNDRIIAIYDMLLGGDNIER